MQDTRLNKDKIKISDYQSRVRNWKTEKTINESFNGSLPAFIAPFMNSKKISADEADEIPKMIDKYRKG